MAEMSMYDLAMLIWLDGMRWMSHGYSICKLLLCDDCLLVRGIYRYTAPVISMEILSQHLTETLSVRTVWNEILYLALSHPSLINNDSINMR